MMWRWGRRLALVVCLFTGAAFAQDERRVTSPNGQLEFRLFVASQKDTTLFRVAYQVWRKGKLLVDTSFMGVDIWEQEPLLGENDGLIGSSTTATPMYNGLVAKYMQNGSLGRRLDIEIRAYDDAVAFRYAILRSTGLEQVRISDEATEFAVVPGSGVSIAEVPVAGFPAMHLGHSEGDILLTRLEHLKDKPTLAFEGTPPLTLPWRVVVVNADKKAAVVGDLGR